MRQALKNELKSAFEAPEPLHKRRFLRTLEQPKISTAAFVISQMGYIRRWIWIVSVFIFVFAVICTVRLSADMFWAISALMPMLALTVVCESGRSENYEMAELEKATRFSLKSVVLARLGILGIENLMILGLLLPIEIWGQGLGLIQAGIYVLMPYLLMTFVGLSIVRRFRGREAVGVCIGVAVSISLFVMSIQNTALWVYQPDTLVWWICGVIVLCMGTARQCIGMVRDIMAA